MTTKNVDRESFLNSKRKENINKLVFAYLNINSFRNKFELLKFESFHNLSNENKELEATYIEINLHNNV